MVKYTSSYPSSGNEVWNAICAIFALKTLIVHHTIAFIVYWPKKFLFWLVVDILQ